MIYIKANILNNNPKIDEILSVLPKEYYNLANIFLKRKSNKLLSYYKRVNYKIILEEEVKPRYYSLYKLLVVEL